MGDSDKIGETLFGESVILWIYNLGDSVKIIILVYFQSGKLVLSAFTLCFPCGSQDFGVILHYDD